MCGIAGFIEPNTQRSTDERIKILNEMGASIEHRGPDSSDIWLDAKVGIGLVHQRLAVVDLTEAGSQPMASPSGRYMISFNGEIYNHQKIRKRLGNMAEGARWKGASDTETLLLALETFGLDATLELVEGMFGFALWDLKIQKLYLVRDRVGEKPLYYGYQGNTGKKCFLFGSELKALRRHPNFESIIDKGALALQMQYGYVPTPHSIYRGIYKLRPGHYLEIDNNDVIYERSAKQTSYWSASFFIDKGASDPWIGSLDEATKELDRRLSAAIENQSLADVAVGSFLSGGVDSSLVSALMQRQRALPIQTFSIGFEEAEFDEAPYASSVARHLNTNHTELYVTDKQALSVIPLLANLYDEPFSDSSQIPTYLVAKLARQDVTVALTGDGGDELFGGYNRHLFARKYWPYVSAVPLPLRSYCANILKSIPASCWQRVAKSTFPLRGGLQLGDQVNKVSRILAAEDIAKAYLNLVSHWSGDDNLSPFDVKEEPSLFNLFQEFAYLDDFEQIMAADFLTYLPDDILVKVDRASMGVSLETRLPFLDRQVMEYAWSLPATFKIRNGQSKYN